MADSITHLHRNGIFSHNLLLFSTYKNYSGHFASLSPLGHFEAGCYVSGFMYSRCYISCCVFGLYIFIHSVYQHFGTRHYVS